MEYLHAIATSVAMLTFFGIVAWAWSKGRVDANRDASMLPFIVPDEDEVVNSLGDSK